MNQRDSFDALTSRAVRTYVAGAMGMAGLVFGTAGARDLELPWSAALPVGVVACVVMAKVAWHHPESFFKNRS